MPIPKELLEEIGYELARVTTVLSKVEDADWEDASPIQAHINQCEELLSNLETAA